MTKLDTALPSMTTAPDAGRAVLVVGAGPVGLVVACELARRGVGVRIVDRLAAPTTQSRAILVHSRSLEMFDRMGILDQLLATGIRTTAMCMHSGGRRLAEFTFDGVDSTFPFSLTTAQTETERVLRVRLAELGVRIDRGLELVDLQQPGDGGPVAFRLRAADGTVQDGTAHWVVGTDGAHSAVRGSIGQRLQGSFKGERFINADVDATSDLPRDRMHSFFSPGELPLMVFPMLGQRTRIIAMIPADDVDETVDVPRLQALVDRRAAGITVTAAHWLSVFQIHHAQVPKYRTGRVLLAGDAAHVHSPAGGQGMNTGMQDAFNLGWKLAAVACGAADATLLDSYHDERHPVARRVITSTTRTTRMGTLQHRAQQVVRNSVVSLVGRVGAVRQALAEQLEETDIGYRHSPIVAGRARRSAVQPGDHAPDVAGTGLREAMVGAGPGTVAIVFGSGPSPLLAALDGLPIIRVGHGVEDAGSQAVPDQDGRIAHRYGARDGGVVLVRPDGYVGFVGEEAETESLADYRRRTGCTVADRRETPREQVGTP